MAPYSCSWSGYVLLNRSILWAMQRVIGEPEGVSPMARLVGLRPWRAVCEFGKNRKYLPIAWLAKNESWFLCTPVELNSTVLSTDGHIRISHIVHLGDSSCTLW